ncbi:hypothetical protein F4801DRAFT_534870 [Xylaria longipes]|nr:hypothetical protein F4801DRAFT_534870 [Xylaria longipes]RYC66089.1 hypothetical protein CHU98_g154 [Xylaria longipes]
MATQKSAARGAQTTTQILSVNASIAEAETQEVTPYSQALSRLEPLQPVLAGLAHRNHNQHRRAAWWRCFGMLRRNCAKLVENLVVAIAAARKNAARAAKAAKTKSKKRRREELASGRPVTEESGNDAPGVQGSEPEIEIVASHAAWLHNVLAPKCYLAFSQLTADNQFAPLGVVLLGILAQIKAACDCLAPRLADPLLSSPSVRGISAAAERKLSSTENPTIVAQNGNTAAIPALGPGLTTNETQLALEETQESRRKISGGDGGKTISREDVERAAEQRKKGKETGKTKAKRDVQPTTIADQAKAGTLIKGTTETPSGKRQVLSAQVDQGDEGARAAKKVKTASITKEKAKGESNDNDKSKKKKKKIKKGDEFDDLFKGLF